MSIFTVYPLHSAAGRPRGSCLPFPHS